jgi:hypothetical protein
LLFDRKSTRKPQLTEAGRGVLSDARTITNGINGLRANVRSLRQDIEAEISLVLDVMLPAERKLPNVAPMFTTGIVAPAQAGVQGHRLCACPLFMPEPAPGERRGQALGARFRGHDER